MLKSRWRKWKHTFSSYFLAYASKYIIKFLLLTCKMSIEGLERFAACVPKEKCIIMLWHNRLALVPEILYRYAPQFIYTALISNSQDGDPLAILAHSYSSGRTIRAPHNARHFALKKLIYNLKAKGEIIIITPDGPRGPRYKIKPGILLAAQETQATLIPLSWTADRYWEFNTWDRFRLPKPFSTIRVELGEPFKIETLNQANDRKNILHALAHSLDSLNRPNI
jgi:lysophospholipid acyltransferase (LPLAT)-like uncharacterized protein